VIDVLMKEMKISYSYDEQYENDLLRGDEDPRPWDLLDIIQKRAKKSDILLDIGCGTAWKILKVKDTVSRIYGLEPNEKMRAKAKENIRKTKASNIVLVNGYAEELPFNKEFFDIVTCMTAPHDTLEIFRVLKPGGYAIVEKIGDRDKWNIKQEFGSDNKGLRGYLSDLEEGERARIYEKEFKKLFSKVSIQTGSWKTYYTLEGLILLLGHVIGIRNFDKKKDKKVLQQIQKKYMTKRGIETTQERILIIAKK